MDSGGSGDPSLFVDSPVNIEGLQGLDGSGWEEETLNKDRVDEISSCSAIYEGGNGDGSRSVL